MLKCKNCTQEIAGSSYRVRLLDKKETVCRRCYFKLEPKEAVKSYALWLSGADELTPRYRFRGRAINKNLLEFVETNLAELEKHAVFKSCENDLFYVPLVVYLVDCGVFKKDSFKDIEELRKAVVTKYVTK